MLDLQLYDLVRIISLRDLQHDSHHAKDCNL